MKLHKFKCYTKRYIYLVMALLYPQFSHAGFLEMPEISEVPELERKSMLKDLDIPGVRERDPDPEAGPRLNVMKFKLQGIVEYPELGITRADIDKLIEGIRFDLMEEYKLLDSGFTESELAEVSNKLVEIEEETMDRHVTEMDLQQLIWLVREQRSKRGVTLGKIETVADRITQFYRERGFILAKAYIPEQQVREGVVTLTLLLGTLGDVELKDSQLYKRESLISVFDNMMGKPVTSGVVEEDLYLLNDYPGVSAVGFFEPGEQVGDTRLQLNILDESRYQGLVKVDNYGTDLTGKYRVYAEGNVNNLAGMSDQLTLGVLNTFSPENSYYGQIKYSVSLFSPRLFFSLGYSTNQFVLGKGSNDAINALELNGETSAANAALLYKIKRSRISSHSIQVIRNNVVSTLKSDATGVNLQGYLDNEVDSTELNYTFDVLNEKGKKLHQGNLSFLNGRLKSKLAVDKKKDFSVFSGNYTFLTFLKIPFTEVISRILLKSSWQYSEESLSSINQFSIAGPTTVKAFSVNTFSADSAVYAGAEWIFDKPSWLDFNVYGKSLSDVVQPYIFVDASYGVQKALQAGDEDINATLADAGIGFRLNMTKNASGNIQFAFPVEKSFSASSFDVKNDEIQVVFDFQYTF